MPRDKYAYDQQYLKENITKKSITFNRNKPEDMRVLEWINQQNNSNQYIKGLVLEDMERKGQK